MVEIVTKLICLRMIMKLGSGIARNVLFNLMYHDVHHQVHHESIDPHLYLAIIGWKKFERSQLAGEGASLNLVEVASIVQKERIRRGERLERRSMLLTRRASTAFSYHNPVKVHFGWGIWDHIIPQCMGGRKVLLLTYPQAECTGLFTNLRSVLGEESCKKWFIACPEQPDLNEARGLYRRVKNLIADRNAVIVAVGGGSVIDLAKTMSLAKSEVDFEDIFQARVQQGKTIDRLNHVPVIAVPTTAGAGSEVTSWATIWDFKAKKKYSVQGHSLYPETAIVDPSLAVSCPALVTRNCALDALSHALESIWNVHHNPISDTLAVAAARGVLINLPIVLQGQQEGHKGEGDEPVKRARIALSAASLRAGLAFSNTETALAHALSFPITIENGIKHGVACSFSLPRVMKLAMGRDPERDALLAEVFTGIIMDNKDPVTFLETFLEDVGVSTKLADYGLDGHEDFQARVAKAATHPRGKNFITSSFSEFSR